MREKRDHSVRSTSTIEREAKKKYYLVCEGTETEPIYFDALKKYIQYSKINPLIELVPIVKGESESGWSNPKKLLNCIISELEACGKKTVTYLTLIDAIVDKLCPCHEKPSVFCNLLVSIVKSKVHEELSDPVDDINFACKEIADATRIADLVDIVPAVIKESYSLSYQEGFDKICFVIDRDRRSFIKSEDSQKDQYGYVVSTCKARGFGFYLTNPCFEYWLLLHFVSLSDLDEEKLLENEKCNSRLEKSHKGKTYTERKLNEVFPGYKKNGYSVEDLVIKLDDAIDRANSGCINEEDLEHRVGSRMGILICELRGESL